MTDWAAIYFELSKEFRWTPDTIDRLTLQQLVHYLEKLHEYRENIKPADLELTQIRQALFAFLGVSERDDKKIDEQIAKSGFPNMKVSKKAMEAWEKAGMPNPQKFFTQYKGKKNG